MLHSGIVDSQLTCKISYHYILCQCYNRVPSLFIT